MNCAALFAEWAKTTPTKAAIVTVDGKSINFGELAQRAGGVERELLALGLTAGDKALVMAMPSRELYATTLALMGLGVAIVFVEPWMPLQHIERVVTECKPKVFIAQSIFKLWGLRIRAIREITHWASPNALCRRARPNDFIVSDVPPHTAGIITFTTGTTGNPKGVLRTQGYLIDQHDVLTKSLGLADDSSCDLTIFANFVFSNLARGATSLLVPSKWTRGNLKNLDELAEIFRPKTITCGPAFLLSAMSNARFSSLDHFHVGGALTDIKIFERAFNKWPDAHFTHVYGSSEAEPVAAVDARVATLKSREHGFFQTLYFGMPVPDARVSCTKDSLWVSGRHVCPKYVNADGENERYKKIDEHGVLWHDMGDRVVMNDGLWYSGRSSQACQDFLLEQELYSQAQSSASFLTRDHRNQLIWCGQNLSTMKEIASVRKDIFRVIQTNIVRDRRHRARIDRAGTMKKIARSLHA